MGIGNWLKRRGRASPYKKFASTNLATQTTRKSVKARVAMYLNTMIVAMFMMVRRMMMMMIVVVMRKMVICSPEFGVWGVLE